MFTVLIAEKEHISSIENYKIFLKPYLNDHFGLCEWIPGEETLSRAVPTLEKTVSPYRQWRAVILCEEEGLLLRNPFEVVTCNCPIRPEYADEETLTAYLQAVRKEKCRAYDEASKKPLVRLVTRLCEEPLAVSENRKDPARQDTQDAEPVEGTMVRKMDLEFDEYWYEAQYKNQLRQQILGEERINFYYPAEVICIAKRTHEEEAYAVASAWATHDVSQYRRFYDWNMYYDKMRYVAYDILPRNHTQYPTEYLKFLATVLLIAGHELPPDALRPHFVYAVQGESEDDALGQLLRSYDKKLCATAAEIEDRVRQMENDTPRKLSDAQINEMFGGNSNISVSIENRAPVEALYAETSGFGMATDVPVEERDVWAGAYKTSRASVLRMVKLAPRGLKRAGETLRVLAAQNPGNYAKLDAFQKEDIAEKIDHEELSLARLFSQNGFYPKKYEEELTQSADAVYDKIETRITMRQIIIMSVLAVVSLLVGFIPLVIRGMKNLEGEQVSAAMLLFACTLALLAGTALVCLLLLRGALKKKVDDYNNTVKGINDELSASLAQYSSYLGHLCAAMRGFRALNYLSENEPESAQVVRIYRKHQADILMQRCLLRTLFGEYLPALADVTCQDEEPYPFEFELARDYQYDMPLQKGDAGRIEFFDRGNMISVSSTFIRRVSARLEEYYD